MDERVEKVLNLPAYQRVLIVLVIMVVIAAGFYFAFYQSQIEEIESLNRRKESAQTLLAKNQRIASKLELYKEEFAKLEEKLKEALNELPLKKEIPSLLTNIGSLARAKGLDIIMFKPKGEVSKEFYAEVPVDLKLGGSYHQAALFFDAIGKMERIVNIQNLKLGGAKEEAGRTTLSIDCRAITFRFIEGQAAQPVKGGQKK